MRGGGGVRGPLTNVTYRLHNVGTQPDTTQVGALRNLTDATANCVILGHPTCIDTTQVKSLRNLRD